MGFDQNSSRPVVNVHKRTTRVNLWMTAIVLLFLAAGGVLVLWARAHPRAVAHSVEQKAQNP